MTQYDKIATEYTTVQQNFEQAKNEEYQTFVRGLLLPALGIKDVATVDLTKVLAGYRVIDLACGSGYYTRKLKEELGCKEVVGVDISPAMIDIARTSEKNHPLGITYQIADVLNLTEPEKKFDLVVAAYLLNYATTLNELEKMVRIISEQLGDNNEAYFLGINANVCCTEHIVNTDIYRKFGYWFEAQLPLIDGAQIKNNVVNPDGSILSFITYYFSPAIYEQAFQKAGFKYFKWVPIESVRDTELDKDSQKYQPIIGISAHK
ncbi:hypothetical protein I4U23_010782 [Adineta vaga]|nr:hypothetical protein I4U23_010782 [Adineta vaga]